jgi:hypothetical protein
VDVCVWGRGFFFLLQESGAKKPGVVVQSKRRTQGEIYTALLPKFGKAAS